MFPKYQGSEEKSKEKYREVILRQMAIEIEHINMYERQQKQF